VSDLPHLPAGVYQHHKGPLYLVLGYGHDANYPDRDVVVYVGLQLDEAKTGPRLAVRTPDASGSGVWSAFRNTMEPDSGT
jgi:hypothetical protein